MPAQLMSLIARRVSKKGEVAEWSCSALQLRSRRFDSCLRLQLFHLHLLTIHWGISIDNLVNSGYIRLHSHTGYKQLT